MPEPYEDLVLKYLRGSLSPEERRTFESWLSQSEEHRKMVNDFKSIWQLSDGKDSDFQKEKEWAKLQSSLLREAERMPVMGLSNNPSLKIAASMALVLISSFLLYWFVFRTSAMVYQTAGETGHVILPDGSEVWLNERSKLVFQSDFKDARSLDLDGEGFFEVKPNPEKPFVIHTDETQIEVLGTSFNVKAYKEEPQAEVFVVTGKVSFSTRNKSEKVSLLPGSNGIFNKKDRTLISKNEENLNALMWKEKRLVFKKTPLREVVKTLRNYFKTEIEIKNEVLLDCRFTSSFNNPTLPEVIDVLSLAMNLKVEHQSDTYSLYGMGCNSQ